MMRLTVLLVFALVVVVLGMIVTDAIDGTHLPTVPATATAAVIPPVFDVPISDDLAVAPVVVLRHEIPRAHETAPMSVGAISIASTGYCETGLMANGAPAHDGAVSSHVLKRGSRWRVLDGLYAGNVYTVEDTGPAATFDIAMPGRCDEATAYGRRFIHIEAVA